jgi:Zn finger protein HypA/HybF involved in hydrogenase expression
VAYYNAEGTIPVGSSGDTVEEATARLKSFHPDAEIRVIPRQWMGYTCPICEGENVQPVSPGEGYCPDCGAREIELPHKS